ncbi:MAG: hypothetical protein RI894_385 [Bacteroidota bacterium]|jgi:16S rRNA (guanine(966)-N(2))-methyltransferase RsmD
MRIISGKFKGRQFTAPIDPRVTRPTTDLAKESLFNILANRFDFDDDQHALDLFAGTGSIGYEFISRGVGEVTCVENAAPLLRFIRQNAFVLGIKNYVHTVKEDVFKWIPQAKGQQFDFIFADPPYAMHTITLLPDLIFEYELLKDGGIIIVEHDIEGRFKDHPRLVDEREYGKTIFSFFE